MTQMFAFTYLFYILLDCKFSIFAIFVLHLFACISLSMLSYVD